MRLVGGAEELGDGDPREISGYPLYARLGEGGMGTVYLSRTRGNRPVALKVIRREHAEDPHYRRRFAREAQAARKVAGYHLVPVLDFDTEAEQPWIATAYQPGPDLGSVLEAYSPLPVATVLQITGCVARALHAVHTAGYVHRDVKPGNVLIGADGPWLIDFGIARSADSTNLTATGGLVGTLRFMSPEHARGREPGPPSDVFSLGLLAAVAATGRHPYGDGDGLVVAAAIAGTDARPPHLDGCPEPVRRVLRAALAADPADRPDAAELAALCEDAAGRPLTDFDGWLPGPVASAVASVEAEASRLTARVRTAGPPPPPPAPAGFGPPPLMPPASTVPQHTEPASRVRRMRVLAAAVAVLAVAGTAVAVAWVGRDEGDRTVGTGQDTSGGPSAAPSQASQQPAQDDDGGRPVPHAPEGYRLVFANKPFTFAPPPEPDRATHLDLDVPRSTYLERAALPGPAELVYNSDGWLGSMLVVVGERTTICTEEQQTAVLSHPLPAAELRLGRQVKVGTVLCSITSNDNIAEAEVTEIIPGEGADGLPTYKGYVTVWKSPASGGQG
ncbi:MULTISPECIES: serine/threonine-protein kinase [unclassified Streptomyces]|uniref:serine/threonine-protein kinase n=1 Tax=unclassified Streptomyces TaxID=2593676 RepID=UPI000F6CBE9D|nr:MULTISPECIES: serine/threonine-protein kinase [unclassified Streptomyces]AZM59503.1 serine/threonine protein kinase [Streptomyces sp. WAC 01438]RSM95743.1 serine/threonine protein kinase [Streptomyces sp. WAC 01420]